jgi:hypothetical protein
MNYKRVLAPKIKQRRQSWRIRGPYMQPVLAYLMEEFLHIFNALSFLKKNHISNAFNRLFLFRSIFSLARMLSFDTTPRS